MINYDISWYVMTNAAWWQISICLGSSQSMILFAIEEAPSPLPALYATLVSTITFGRQKSEYGQRQSYSLSHLEKKNLSASKHRKWCSFLGHEFKWSLHFQIAPTVSSYLIFVIFFTLAKFLKNKIYTEKRQFFALNL